MYCTQCGKYSGKYDLCKDCYYQKTDYDEVEEYDQNEDYSNCITCDKKKNDDGYLFCKECYKKYKDKAVILKITNCRKIQILDDFYEGRYKCKDGHIVKSKAEKIIDDWFYDHKIDHIYEPDYASNNGRIINPDWKLPNYIRNFWGIPIDVYVEYWGIENNEQYENIKDYKLNIYKNDKITLVNLRASYDKNNLELSLNEKILKKKIKPHKSNY